MCPGAAALELLRRRGPAVGGLRAPRRGRDGRRDGRRRGAAVARRPGWRGVAVTGGARRRGEVVLLLLGRASVLSVDVLARALPLPRSEGSRIEVKGGGRRLVEVAHVAAEVFLAPLLVLPLPLQVALLLRIKAAVSFPWRAMRVLRAPRFSAGALASPPGAVPARR